MNITLIVKYGYGDAYISLIESLKHSCYKLGKNVQFNWIDVRNMSEKDLIQQLKQIKGGIVVPGGFGGSGVENKILAIKYAREKNIPLLGICYGM